MPRRFGATWNTSSTPNGSHTLTAMARDAAGNSATSAPIAVSTLYHYRVRSRDAAGNLTVSGDFTFTTLPSGSTGTLIAHLGFDEGTGTTTADLSGHGHTGTLATGATWPAGTTGPGVALDGVGGHVGISHTPMLNAFPLSAAAWFKTSTTSGVVGVINKYTANSYDGYQVFFENGSLCAWYLRSTSNYVYDGGSCTMRTAGYNVDDVTVVEGNGGTTSATFQVTLSSISAGPVSVSFATLSATATAGEDYESTSGTLTFEPGESVKTVTVAVNGDTAAEANETFLVNLSAASGAVISRGQGQGTIVDDEVACPLSPVAPGATFTVVVSGNTPADWVASYAPGAPDTCWTGDFQYVPLPRPASVTLTAPVADGTYDLRLLANDTYTLIGSCSYEILAGP